MTHGKPLRLFTVKNKKKSAKPYAATLLVNTCSIHIYDEYNRINDPEMKNNRLFYKKYTVSVLYPLPSPNFSN